MREIDNKCNFQHSGKSVRVFNKMLLVKSRRTLLPNSHSHLAKSDFRAELTTVTCDSDIRAICPFYDVTQKTHKRHKVFINKYTSEFY